MYKYDEKEVEVFGKKHTAYFPKRHSTVKAVVFKRWDNNADDRPWANITDNRTILYVLWKGYHKWESLCNGEYGKTSKYAVSGGLSMLLRSMENDDTKHKLWRKECIIRLKKDIKGYTRMLKTLLKEEEKEKSKRKRRTQNV
jgi:hypothetical protein